MRPTRVVVALGGNALLRKGAPASAEEQLSVVYKTSEYLAEMSYRGNELAIVHGNGPQVGNIVLTSENSADIVPPMPLDVCGAMSQGYIGYHIQQALRFCLLQKSRNIPVTTIVTQVVVCKDDPAFDNPSKPIGPFYSKEEAGKIAREKGYIMANETGRGWRRVVASPVPQRIVEFSCLKELWDTTIVITAGGGGIPVIEAEDGSLQGIAAVIDKDLAASRLASDIEADILMILTEVDKVALNFNQPDQKDLDHICVEEAEKYIKEGHFAPGSMLPKIQAAVAYVKENPGKKAIITSLFNSIKALDEETGTLITS
ncbi:MAG: carbamate kinase [Bacillota bacterium]